MRRRVLILAVIAFVGYLVLLLAVWLQQDALVFPGAGRGVRPLDVEGVATRTLVGRHGEPFRVVECVPAAPRAVVVHFVGNGEDLCSAARTAVTLARHGVAVVAAEYPGYGASGGRPGVDALLHNAEITATHAGGLARQLGVPLIASGSSLGTFSAVHVAAKGGIARCLLRAPATSIADVAARQFWWLPVRALLRHPFDNTVNARAVTCPVLIVHGADDLVIPVEFGERLRALFAGEAEFVVVPGAGHNDLSLAPEGPVGERVGAFLRGP